MVKQPLASLAAALLFAASALAGGDLTVIDLHFRDADELVGLIQPLLGSDERVVPNGSQLLLRAGPNTVQQVRDLLRQIDKRPHRLRISVLQNSDVSAEQLNARIDAPVHAWSSDGDGRSGQNQQVETMDGQTAEIRSGTLMPVPAPPVYGYGYGSPPGINYRPVTGGFSVTPRLQGNEVVLKIDRWWDRPSHALGGGSIDTQSGTTTVRVPLGEWINIGGQVETSEREETTPLSHRYATRTRGDQIILRVEDLDATSP